MIKTNYFKRFTILLLFLFTSVNIICAQTANFPQPNEEKLLNGLKLLVWNTPNSNKVSVKLRIHSGSIFDQENKEGTMALLGEILFPNLAAAKEYFKQDLNGSLEIKSTFDYIQINATGDSDKFLIILQTIATAVTNPEITKVTTAQIISIQKEKLNELKKNPEYLADRAVAEKIYLNFPYGRAQIGTDESLNKIDFADLIFARQRFLAPNNATLAIYGNVKPDFAYRAVRRYLGSWVKSDEKVPATFRQPAAPDANFEIFDSPSAGSSELRFALRSVARGDKNYFASLIFSKILQNRLAATFGEKVSVVNSDTILPSFLEIKLSDWELNKIQNNRQQSDLSADAKNLIGDLLKKPVTAEEFDKAKKIAFADTISEFADFWLDIDTFRLTSVKDELQKSQNVALKDVQAVAENYRKQPVAGVLLVNSQKSDKIPEAPKQTDNE